MSTTAIKVAGWIMWLIAILGTWLNAGTTNGMIAAATSCVLWMQLQIFTHQCKGESEEGDA